MYGSILFLSYMYQSQHQMFFLKIGMSSVYCNKMVTGRWFKSHLFLMILEAGEPKFKVTTRIAPGKGSSRLAESHFLTVS